MSESSKIPEYELNSVTYNPTLINSSQIKKQLKVSQEIAKKIQAFVDKTTPGGTEHPKKFVSYN